VSEAQKTEINIAKLKDLKAKNYLFQTIDRLIFKTILSKDYMKKKYQGSTKTKKIKVLFYSVAYNLK